MNLQLADSEGIQIIGFLGEGGMAAVYRGVQAAFHREVAIKVMHRHLYTSPEHVARFMREARMLAMLNHQNIVHTFNVGVTTDQVPFIVMELVEGQTLDHILEKQGTLNAEQFKHIFSNVLDGLQYAHDNGYVHRDLKPSNVMVTTDGGVKIMDFGIAKCTESSSAMQSVTATGEVLGSPAYMSPEQAQNTKKTGASSDFYSVGCMMFECLQGRRPFEADNAIELLMKHVTETPPPLKTGSPAVNELICRALQKDPQFRFQSAVEMKEQMLVALKDTRKPTCEVRRKKKKTRQAVSASQLAVLCAVIAIGLGITIFVVNQHQAEELSEERRAVSPNELMKSATNEVAKMAWMRGPERHQQFERALGLYRRAEKMIHEQHSERDYEFKIETYLGSLYVNDGQCASGLEHLLKAWQILQDRPTASASDRMLIYSCLSQAYQGLADYPNQLKYQKMNYDLMRSEMKYRRDNNGAIPLALQFLSQAYANNKDYKSACQCTKEAYELCVKEHLPQHTIDQAESYYGLYLFSSGNHEEGRRVTLHAAKDLQKLALESDMEEPGMAFAGSLDRLASCYPSRNDRLHYLYLLKQNRDIEAQQLKHIVPKDMIRAVKLEP